MNTGGWGDVIILRRVTSFLLLFILICAMLPCTALASDPQFTGTIGAKAWMLFDADSGKALAFSDNRDEKIEPASTTKIMTLLVAIESGKLSETVTISAHAAGVGGSTCDLKSGEKIILKNLLTAMMMKSGNDAATAVAEFLGSNEEGFAELMNAKAAELGMTNTHFVTPHGMHKEDHYTTLNDMAKLASAAMKNTTFMDIVGMPSYTMPENNQKYDNANPLLNSSGTDYYPYANGMKTGSTDEAGDCLVASASHEGTNLICLLFGYPDDKGDDRWPAARELFDFGFNNYQTVNLSDVLKDTQPVQKPVENSSSTDEKGGLLEFALPSEGAFATLSKDVAAGLLNGTDSVDVAPVFTSGETLQAPIRMGDVLGTVTYMSKNTGETLYSGPLVAARDVLQAGTESNVNGGTAVTKLPPMIPEKLSKKNDHSGIWLWALVPLGLIAFLVFRLVTVNRKRRKRFTTRKKPQYSYKIRR
jgi:D-alanyl-D-alanine carboxypeptidase